MTNSKKVHEDFLTFDRILGLDQLRVVRSILAIGHVLAAWYLWLDFYMGAVPSGPRIFEIIYGVSGGFGITVGCHRYWTHRSFKATLPLQIIMMICQTITMQLPIRKWCLDHRLHHKYTDTNRDPHNSTRGFWFSHIGWLLLPKHPELVKELKRFDVSDLDNDPVVRFQSKWYVLLAFIFHLVIPITITKCFWPEMTFWQCNGSAARRFVVSSHITFTVNSFAHLWGSKPYDGNVSAAENRLVSSLALGEGWHNFHHAFPWDYRASEFGWKLNVSTMVIDFFAWVGWACDLKMVSPQVVKMRMCWTGNNTKTLDGEHNSENCETTLPDKASNCIEASDHAVWGWGDESISEDMKKVTTITNTRFKKDFYLPSDTYSEKQIMI